MPDAIGQSPRQKSAGGEKERVYRELELTQRKCGALRREVTSLRESATAKETAVARREAAEYRKALSNILYRLDNDSLTAENLRSIIDTALTLKALKQHHRDEIEALRSKAGGR
jgi:Mg2+ and Co2+ transporter CorA